MINIEDFKKVEIRIGKIVSAEKLAGADKLLKFRIDFGNEERQILSGIAEFYTEPESLVGKLVPVIVNLEPRVMKGEESQGMMLVAIDNERPILLNPASEVSPGSEVR